MTRENFNRIICQRILNLRVKLGLTQEQLAYQSGISKGGLSEIERNMKEPSNSISITPFFQSQKLSQRGFKQLMQKSHSLKKNCYFKNQR